MKLLRALLFLLLVSGPAGEGLLQYNVAAAAAISSPAPAAAEDAATQSRTFGEAYNLLLDHYVHPLDTPALLRAGWDELGKEAAGKAAAPGPAPAFSGDRVGDLDTMRAALTAYIGKPNSSPEGFVAVHALVRGMVRFVDEGHTYFLDPQQYTDYQSWSAGDLLVRIADQSVAGLALDEMTGLVRGPAGTSVQIVVRRGSDPKELTFSVERAEIHLQFVKQRSIEDDIGYVSLRGFPEPSVVDAIEQDVTKFQAAGVQGLVLDLRGNSGGRIDVGTRLLGHFLAPGSSVYEEVDRGGDARTHFSPRGGTQYNLPLVVLVDGGTASMGEIFASAVQEHGAATILGSTTAGSVAAAQVFGLPDGAGLQVTVFEIRSADGKPLNKIGVVPDEVIDPDPVAIANGDDPVLGRAVEILHDQLAARNPGSGVSNP